MDATCRVRVQAVREAVEAKGFEVVDDRGRTRADLSLKADGSPALACWDAARAVVYRAVKLVRTIADPAGAEQIAVHHPTKAVQYRGPDRRFRG
jgi:predicted ATPase with chaperone activity